MGKRKPFRGGVPEQPYVLGEGYTNRRCHSSITVTLDTYGHLFPDEQEKIAASLDALWADNA